MALLDVGLRHFVFVAAVLFSLGAFTIVTRKNAVGMLMGVELILNSANLNLVAFSHYVTHTIGGQVFALFIIVIAAAEAAVALAIVLAIYQNYGTIDASRVNTMQG
jgi:NADH-quinone oxidoreductase subunit K